LFHTHDNTVHCEHYFDSKMHFADTVGVWRIIFVIRLLLNYVMLSSLHLLHMLSTHHFHSNAAAMASNLYDSIADKW
jgi:hypothetical protein